MSILLAPDTPPTAAAQIETLLRADNTDAIRGMMAHWKKCFDLVWNSPDATAQEVFDQFTTSGGKLIDALQARLDFIEALAIANAETLDDYIASGDRTPPGTATVAMDGTVTVT